MLFSYRRSTPLSSISSVGREAQHLVPSSEPRQAGVFLVRCRKLESLNFTAYRAGIFTVLQSAERIPNGGRGEGEGGVAGRELLASGGDVDE